MDIPRIPAANCCWSVSISPEFCSVGFPSEFGTTNLTSASFGLLQALVDRDRGRSCVGLLLALLDRDCAFRPDALQDRPRVELEERQRERMFFLPTWRPRERPTQTASRQGEYREGAGTGESAADGVSIAGASAAEREVASQLPHAACLRTHSWNTEK